MNAAFINQLIQALLPTEHGSLGTVDLWVEAHERAAIEILYTEHSVGCIVQKHVTGERIVRVKGCALRCSETYGFARKVKNGIQKTLACLLRKLQSLFFTLKTVGIDRKFVTGRPGKTHIGRLTQSKNFHNLVIDIAQVVEPYGKEHTRGLWLFFQKVTDLPEKGPAA